MTEYPGKEHEQVEATARRRVLTSLEQIELEVAMLRRRVKGNLAEGDDTHQLAAHVRAAIQHISALEVLRNVREWWQADQAEHSADMAEAGALSSPPATP